jgi:aldehyde:ferredoxin oxidoreductase
LAGERIFNLKRIINNKLGITRADDDLPKRLKTVARPDGTAKGKLPDLEEILADYYNLRGGKQMVNHLKVQKYAMVYLV